MCVTTAAEKPTQEPDNLHDLTEPLIDHTEGQLFLNETFKIIMEEVLSKGTDVREKVSSEAYTFTEHRQITVTILDKNSQIILPPAGVWVEGAGAAGSAAGSGAEGGGGATAPAPAESQGCRQVQRQDQWVCRRR